MTDLDYPWYKVVNDTSLEQGDLFSDLELLAPQSKLDDSHDEYESQANILDAVILSQTCDIEQNKITSVVLCPIWSLNEFVDEMKKAGKDHWASSKFKEGLRQGNIPGYHLIDEYSELSLPLSIVDFHEIHSAPIAQIRDVISDGHPRLRMCPPYKEHLAQAFARFFMRVGLPSSRP